MIVTTYKPDGTMTRVPLNYTGGTCNAATAPYEARDVRKAEKHYTDEACLPDNAVAEVETHQTAAQG